MGVAIEAGLLDQGSPIQDHLLDRLRVSVGEAARLTGVSVRQLSYWTQKGLVRALGAPTKKRYDMRALERIALIKRHLNEGYALDEAARQAERLQRSARASRLALDPQELVAQQVAELEELVGYLKRRLAQGAASLQLANQLSRLNVAAVLDDGRRAPSRRRIARA
ncbi:MAG: MerR family transcriptional regulator [Chloroflexi bacterium]|nr:MerR family transcriptional regulator [Chloroflexota bacterium]